MPLALSVVVTNYNYREFVAEAVDGALAQTRAPHEVIVVDDGSADGSPEYLRERYGADPRVTLLCGENGGQLAAFQRGLAAATGEVVCFLDADDRWGPDYLRQVGELFEARADVDFAFSDVRLVGNESGVQGHGPEAADLGYTVLGTWVRMRWYGAPTSALALRRALAARVLDLPRDFVANWRLSADNCLVFGASVLGARKYYLPTGQVDYRIHGRNGWWHQQARMREFAAQFRSRCLVNHYAQRMGLDAHALDLAKAEFKSRARPSWDDACVYADIAMRGPAPWWKRSERALAILLRGLRARRGTKAGA
ncbi:glycosyltransferase family 2 protein [Fulvimonas soli]|jgi:glycosyltransferase involved in cell wall biosynthesis|uniref:Glycosyltransferase involved in cell wall biosynthesis n=1 Tax=Fulvimonas soli TaxID=155197 RepID=A0A316IPF1_9GAMM|nr:glycosyltransferase family A protein [Fulvimonas soli]PWK92408.1 glycosyltransferase involved in cell wall biosynthesis [Fulvimonas soli]TNY25612.1 glycosyl transferase family 2 [Fulvimonas soli]